MYWLKSEISLKETVSVNRRKFAAMYFQFETDWEVVFLLIHVIEVNRCLKNCCKNCSGQISENCISFERALHSSTEPKVQFQILQFIPNAYHISCFCFHRGYRVCIKFRGVEFANQNQSGQMSNQVCLVRPQRPITLWPSIALLSAVEWRASNFLNAISICMKRIFIIHRRCSQRVVETGQLTLV